ncbi:metallophosphoesterase [Brevundimonas sanguinis]|uniref:metallophosphoesterase n=1 Tax=Brevundimonas sanguinis TaxID=3021811 RepID=UPI002414DD60|nr:metallophosphoesterase [Brevundimonas sp. NCCP 15609]
MPPVAPSRRRFLAGVAALPLIGATPAFAADQSAPDVGRARARVVARVLAMSDLHSAYERSAQVLSALRAEVRRQSVPHLIALDGDIFEHGNVVSVRSQGAIDWAFLAALPSIAPTVVNLGNHDNDLTPDLHAVVARMQGLGISVISNIIDARTGQPYAPAATEIALGQRRLRIIGFGTNSLNTYPKNSRDWLSIPDPTDWARAHLPPLLDGADLTLVMSHAGVAGDRGMLSALPDGALMIGGHNHLLFQEPRGRGLYAHTGSWNNAYTAADYLSDGSVRAQSRSVALDGPADPALAALIRATLAQHLSAQERAVLGTSPAALSLGDTGRAVAAAFARFAGAQAGFIGHTTLGTGLPAGPISRYAFDAVVRFDGKLMAAEVPAARLSELTALANQDRVMPFARRTGDFVYGAVQGDEKRDTIRIVTTDWCALNQQEYFGVADLDFTEVPGPGVKAVAAQGLLQA